MLCEELKVGVQHTNLNGALAKLSVMCIVAITPTTAEHCNTRPRLLVAAVLNCKDCSRVRLAMLHHTRLITDIPC